MNRRKVPQDNGSAWDFSELRDLREVTVTGLIIPTSPLPASILNRLEQRAFAGGAVGAGVSGDFDSA